MVCQTMFGIQNKIPFTDSFILIDTIVMITTLFFMIYFYAIKIKLLGYLEKPYTENKIKIADELLLCYANKAIINSILCLVSSFIIYIMFYIMQ